MRTKFVALGRLAAAAVLSALVALACSGGSGEVETAASRGKAIYENVCTTCHARDPNQAGVLGPPVAGASEELLMARVVRGEYPPGYTPKRNTRQMPALPHLEPYIGDLAAYLAAAAR